MYGSKAFINTMVNCEKCRGTHPRAYDCQAGVVESAVEIVEEVVVEETPVEEQAVEVVAEAAVEAEVAEAEDAVEEAAADGGISAEEVIDIKEEIVDVAEAAQPKNKFGRK